MQAVLVMFRADGERRSFSITRDMTVLGRREDCDLRIPLGEVSRKHCRLVRDGDSLKVEDLGSSNGTFLNGKRVQEALLSPGDSIQVGPIVFVLQVDGTPADDELSPVTVDTAAAAAAGPASAAAVGELGDDLSPDEAGAGADAGELEELDPLEPSDDAEADADAPAVALAGDAGGEEDIEELEPLEDLDSLDLDLDDGSPASSASGDLRIDLDAEKKSG